MIKISPKLIGAKTKSIDFFKKFYSDFFISIFISHFFVTIKNENLCKLINALLVIF